MWKLITLLAVFTLAACSENSNNSSDAPAEQNSQVDTQSLDSSDYAFIVDPALRTCFENSGMSVGQVHTVVCSGKGVQTLEGVQQLENLKNLNLSHNQISDLSPLSASSLEVLYATNNEIADIQALAGMASLKEVSLRKNNLQDASPLYGLTALNRVYVQDNGDLNIDPSQLNAEHMAL